MNILLHICCSTCSLEPVRLLRSGGHRPTGFWFNPNIHPLEEYHLRLDDLKRLSGEWKCDVHYLDAYRPQDYFAMYGIGPDRFTLNPTAASSAIPPAPGRCRSCYRLRLEKTALHAREQGFDAFSTTLLISPYQDFEAIAATGQELAEHYNVAFLLEDYRPAFRDAVALSKELGLYRQKYCGCIFSKMERETKKNQK